MTDEASLERLIRRWYKRSKPGALIENDVFDAFVCVWIAFNAWGVHATGIETHDRKMIDALKVNHKLHETFEACRREQYYVDEVLKMKDVRVPTHRERPTHISFREATSLPDVLEVMYQIRCNLFHGRKDPEQKDEAFLVGWACLVLSRMLDQLMKRH